MTGKYLITTDGWFIAPDGRSYSAVWGDIEILQDNFLGVKTNRGSTNWYAKVSGEKGHVVVAGCQIHYAVECKDKPSTDKCDDWQANVEHGVKEYKTPSRIYIA